MMKKNNRFRNNDYPPYKSEIWESDRIYEALICLLFSCHDYYVLVNIKPPPFYENDLTNIRVSCYYKKVVVQTVKTFFGKGLQKYFCLL